MASEFPANAFYFSYIIYIYCMSTAIRYMGVSQADLVTLTVTNLPAEVTAASVPVHPQKPENGSRVCRR